MKRILILAAVCVLMLVTFSAVASAEWFVPSSDGVDGWNYYVPSCGLVGVDVYMNDGEWHSLPISFNFANGDESYPIFDDSDLHIYAEKSGGKCTIHFTSLSNAYSSFSCRLRFDGLTFPLASSYAECYYLSSALNGTFDGYVRAYSRDVYYVDDTPSSLSVLNIGKRIYKIMTRISPITLGEFTNVPASLDSDSDRSYTQNAPVYIQGQFNINTIPLLPQQEVQIIYTVQQSAVSNALYQSVIGSVARNYPLIQMVDDVDFSDVGGFLDASVGSFFDLQIFPHVSIGMIFFAILAILLIVVFLKIFAGG